MRTVIRSTHLRVMLYVSRLIRAYLQRAAAVRERVLRRFVPRINVFVSVLLAAVVLTVCATITTAQTSSLYLEQVDPLPPVTASSPHNSLSPGISQVSLAAVRLPEPRRFAINDLITVIVRESIENDSQAELETEKGMGVNGTISAFPKLNLSDLLNFQLTPSSMDDGTPRVNITLENDFEGDGDFSRRDTFTTRVTARVIDIKPNGTIVLEARKYIRNDDEVVAMTLTGTCRHEDVTADNTVLSTQMFDLRLVKEHEGELRKATKKGLITKFFEGLFNF